MSKLNQTTGTCTSVAVTLTNYVRTPEDDKQDRAEQAWKEARNQAACREFLRNNPSGRSTPYF